MSRNLQAQSEKSKSNAKLQIKIKTYLLSTNNKHLSGLLGGMRLQNSPYVQLWITHALWFKKYSCEYDRSYLSKDKKLIMAFS